MFFVRKKTSMREKNTYKGKLKFKMLHFHATDRNSNFTQTDTCF